MSNPSSPNLSRNALATLAVLLFLPHMSSPLPLPATYDPMYISMLQSPSSSPPSSPELGSSPTFQPVADTPVPTILGDGVETVYASRTVTRTVDVESTELPAASTSAISSLAHGLGLLLGEKTTTVYMDTTTVTLGSSTSSSIPLGALSSSHESSPSPTYLPLDAPMSSVIPPSTSLESPPLTVAASLEADSFPTSTQPVTYPPAFQTPLSAHTTPFYSLLPTSTTYWSQPATYTDLSAFNIKKFAVGKYNFQEVQGIPDWAYVSPTPTSSSPPDPTSTESSDPPQPLADAAAAPPPPPAAVSSNGDVLGDVLSNLLGSQSSAAQPQAPPLVGGLLGRRQAPPSPFPTPSSTETLSAAAAAPPPAQTPYFKWDNSSSVIDVLYPAGSINPGSSPVGGGDFYAAPYDMSNAQNMTLEYSVFFPAGFDFVLGGKMPGLYGGKEGCSGGDAAEDCWSSRMMWRKDGNGELYLYVPKDKQTPQLCATKPKSLCDSTYGLSIGRGSFKWKTGAWTTVRQDIWMNTPGLNNGGFNVFVDGQFVMSANDVLYRNAPAPIAPPPSVPNNDAPPTLAPAGASSPEDGDADGDAEDESDDQDQQEVAAAPFSKRYDDGQYHPSATFDDGQYHSGGASTTSFESAADAGTQQPEGIAPESNDDEASAAASSEPEPVEPVSQDSALVDEAAADSAWPEEDESSWEESGGNVDASSSGDTFTPVEEAPAPIAEAPTAEEISIPEAPTDNDAPISEQDPTVSSSAAPEVEAPVESEPESWPSEPELDEASPSDDPAGDEESVESYQAQAAAEPSPSLASTSASSSTASTPTPSFSSSALSSVATPLPAPSSSPAPSATLLISSSPLPTPSPSISPSQSQYQLPSPSSSLSPSSPSPSAYSPSRSPSSKAADVENSSDPEQSPSIEAVPIPSPSGSSGKLLGFTGIFFSTFFGGHEAQWASPSDQHAFFTGFSLRTNAYIL